MSFKVNTSTIKPILGCECGEPLGIADESGAFVTYPKSLVCKSCGLNNSPNWISHVFEKVSVDAPDRPYKNWAEVVERFL